MDFQPSSMIDNLKNKEVVVDTSSLLLAGTTLLNTLPECSLVIPAIVVKELEENRSHTTLGFLAREWLHILEAMRVRAGQKLASGVSLPSHKHVKIRVEPNHMTQKSLPQHLQNGSNDSTILAVAYNIKSNNTNTVLLSNDAPMRLHATLTLGLEAYEFSSVQVMETKPYSGVIPIELDQEEYATSDGVIENGHSLERLILSRIPKGISNGLVSARLKTTDYTRPVLEARYTNGCLEPLDRRSKVEGIVCRSVEQDIALTYLQEDPDRLPIVSLGGSAGTGKTLLSVAAGLAGVQSGLYQKMIVFRSLHEMGRGQELGFLPGDLGDKMGPWAGAVQDAIDVLSVSGKKIPSDNVMGKKLREMIEVSPITYLRGRSLSNSYIILDEAQNFSRSELLNILSRAGEKTKVVLCFDPHQCDNRYLQSGNRSDVWSVVDSLKSEDLFAHITLTKTERSKVAAIASKLLTQ
jgi:PhoH-like ATPase